MTIIATSKLLYARGLTFEIASLMDPFCIPVEGEDQPPSKRSKFDEAFDGPPALAPDLPPVSVSGIDYHVNPMMAEAMPQREDARAAAEAVHAHGLHGDGPIVAQEGVTGTSDGPVIQPEPKILPGAYTQREEARPTFHIPVLAHPAAPSP